MSDQGADFSVRDVKAGAWIFRRGEAGDQMYVIESGRIELLLTVEDLDVEHLVGTLERGDFLGEVTVLSGDPRVCCARAVEDTRLLPLDGAALQRIAEEQLGLAFRMLRTLSERNARLTSQVYDLWQEHFHEKADTIPPGSGVEVPPDVLAEALEQGRALDAAASSEDKAQEVVAAPEGDEQAQSSVDEDAESSLYDEASELEVTPVDEAGTTQKMKKVDAKQPRQASARFNGNGHANSVGNGNGGGEDSARTGGEDSARRGGEDSARSGGEDSARRGGESSASARLVAPDGDLEFQLAPAGETTIGRQSVKDRAAPDIDLSELNEEKTVSRKHARILRRGNGFFLVEQPNVANGTRVNGNLVPEGVPIPLRDGDELCFGTVTVFFRGASL